jgi:hypothetical protein
LARQLSPFRWFALLAVCLILAQALGFADFEPFRPSAQRGRRGVSRRTSGITLQAANPSADHVQQVPLTPQAFVRLPALVFAERVESIVPAKLISRPAPLARLRGPPAV